MTEQTDRQKGRTHTRTHSPLWMPALGEDWILTVHGVQVVYPDRLPEATDWEEDDSCIRCGLYKEDHITDDGRLFCPTEAP